MYWASLDTLWDLLKIIWLKHGNQIASWYNKINQPNFSKFKHKLVIWYMDVSKKNGTSKSYILIGFSIIHHPYWSTTILGNIHIVSSSLVIKHQEKWGQLFITPFPTGLTRTGFPERFDQRHCHGFCCGGNRLQRQSLRIQVCPKKGVNRSTILLWGWDWDHQTYSRKGYGSLGILNAPVVSA